MKNEQISLKKTAVVTGAAGGVGQALVQLLRERGYQVIAIDLRSSETLITAAGVRNFSTNIADFVQVRNLSEYIRHEYEAVDILVNSAGVYATANIELCDPAVTRRVIEVNLLGTMWMCQCFLPLLRRGRRPCIVNISSLYGLIGAPGKAAYCASKWGVRGYSAALRGELEADGIRVTCVLLGGVATDIVSNGMVPDASQQNLENLLLQRVGMVPSAAAEAILRGALRGTPNLKIGL